MYRRYFITGIGTGVGKTWVSGILCRKFGFSYWKPVQTGSSEGTDSEFIRSLTKDLTECDVLKESYVFPEPLSPHYAASLHQVNIDLNAIQVPADYGKNLIIEGAGGILVPLNDHQFMSDLCRHLNAELIVVVSDYLGCINHSLLTFAFLKSQNINVKGIVLNGNFEEEVESIILKYNPFTLIAQIPRLKDSDISTIDDAIRKGRIQFYHDL
jgi:dethiobiotin synthetase